MNQTLRIIAFAALAACSVINATAADTKPTVGNTKPLVLPQAPQPVATPLPFNAQPTSNGAYVPINKSGNVGVSVEGLRNAQPNERGGSVSLTIKTK